MAGARWRTNTTFMSAGRSPVVFSARSGRRPHALALAAARGWDKTMVCGRGSIETSASGIRPRIACRAKRVDKPEPISACRRGERSAISDMERWGRCPRGKGVGFGEGRVVAAAKTANRRHPKGGCLEQAQTTFVPGKNRWAGGPPARALAALIGPAAFPQDAWALAQGNRARVTAD